MKMEQTECSETTAYKIQMLGNYPEERTQHDTPHLLVHLSELHSSGSLRSK